MRIEELLKKMFRTFFIITTGIVISIYLFCLLFNPQASFSLNDIGRILVMALASDLPLFLFYSRKELAKKQMTIRFAIHIFLLLAILIYFSSLWDWIALNNAKEVAVFIFLVLGVYAIVLAINAYQDKIMAGKLNDSLKRRYPS